MRGKRMAGNLELLAPYGGITRVRFKGSSEYFSDLSAIGSPAITFTESYTSGRRFEVNLQG